MISLDDFRYEAYNSDFGPCSVHDIITLGQMLKRRMGHTVLHISTTAEAKHRGLCLLACYLMYFKNWHLSKIISSLGESTLCTLPGFRDAGIGPADYPLSTADVLRGLQLGI